MNTTTGIRKCIEKHCHEEASIGTWCPKHVRPARTNFWYVRVPVSRMSFPEFFWLNVGPPTDNGCREWSGSRSTNGYGHLYVAGKDNGAHRLAYILARGPIADDLEVCHVCDNPPCCEPSHLWLGTKKQNALDRSDKGRGARGESHRSAKLTEDDVRDIRAAVRHGVLQKDVAASYSLSNAALNSIVKGKTWAWLLDDNREYNGDIKPRKRHLGELNPKSKLTPDIVIEIRRLAREEKWTQAQIAGHFNIHQTTVSDILRGKIWSHV